MEKCQNKKNLPKNDNHDTTENCHTDKKWSSENTETIESQVNSLRHNQHFQLDSFNKHIFSINIEFCHYFCLLYNRHKSSKRVWTDLFNCVSFAHTNSNKVQIDGSNFWNTSLIDPQWICKVHVGWPVPFTVQENGVSLPSAQKLGYLAVATKLKVRFLNEFNVVN